MERDLAGFFEHDPRGAAAVSLFGSEARGAASPRSDVDLAVLVRIRFEVQTRNEAFDLEPVLRQYRTAVGRR